MKVESDVLEDKTLLELSDILVKICELVNDITVIDKVIEVSKYVLKYNCRLPFTKYDLNIMRSVEDQILTLLVDISYELDTITVYDNYVEALNHMEKMLRNDDK